MQTQDLTHVSAMVSPTVQTTEHSVMAHMTEDGRDRYLFNKLVRTARLGYCDVYLHEGRHYLGYAGATTMENDRCSRIDMYLINTIPITRQLYTLAHEIGHAADFYANGLLFTYTMALHSWQMGTLNEIQRAIILRKEEIAWQYGKDILINAGGNFRNITGMEEARASDIAGYEERLKIGIPQTRYAV